MDPSKPSKQQCRRAKNIHDPWAILCDLFSTHVFFWNVTKSLDPSKPSKQHLFLNLKKKKTSGCFIGMSGKLNFHEFPPSQTLSLFFDTKLSSHPSGDHLGLLCLRSSHGITWLFPPKQQVEGERNQRRGEPQPLHWRCKGVLGCFGGPSKKTCNFKIVWVFAVRNGGENYWNLWEISKEYHLLVVPFAKKKSCGCCGRPLSRKQPLHPICGLGCLVFSACAKCEIWVC